MAIPEKREDLVAMGYVFDNESKCRSCEAEIEWWITPRGKKMPMRVFQEHGESIRRAHFADCPSVKEWFRDKK